MNATEEKYLSTSQAGRLVGKTRDTVRAWMKAGITIDGRRVTLRRERIGKYFATTREWLDEFLRACNSGRRQRRPFPQKRHGGTERIGGGG